MKYGIEMKDGSLRIMSTSHEKILVKDEIDKWSDGKDVVAIHILQDEHIPEDRFYRDAWLIKDGVIAHNLNKARDIKLNHMRRDRDAKLKELDIESLKAIEAGDEVAIKEIAKQKQALRDATAPLKAAKIESIDQLDKF